MWGGGQVLGGGSSKEPVVTLDAFSRSKGDRRETIPDLGLLWAHRLER